MSEGFKSEKEEHFLRPRAEHAYSKAVEEIALQSAEMVEFQNVVNNARGRFEAIRSVRELLKQHFPDIDKLPPPVVEKPGIASPASNEFMIAKNVVDLLWDKSEDR